MSYLTQYRNQPYTGVKGKKVLNAIRAYLLLSSCSNYTIFWSFSTNFVKFVYGHGPVNFPLPPKTFFTFCV